MSSRLNTVILSFILSVCITNFSIAEERFCLDETGFMYPLFSEKNCNENAEELITKNEFINILDVKDELRKEALENYRSNKNNVAKTEKDITKEDVEKIKKDSLKKIAKNKKTQQLLEKKAQKNKARLERIEKRKLEQEEKRKKQLAKAEERKLLQKRKKLERLAKIEQRKKINEQKKLERLAKIEQRKKINEQKKLERLAKIEQRKKINEQKKLERLAKTKQNKNDETVKSNSSEVASSQTLIINENLELVFYNKKIVKENIIPYVSGEVTLIDSLNKNEFKELTKKNINLVLIIPRDVETFSNTISQNQMTSRIVTGIRQIPNPDYRRLEMEIRDTEKKAMLAKRESEIYEYKLQTQQPTGYGWLDVLGAFANTAGSISYHNNYVNLQNKLNDLISEYSTTPMYLDKEILSPYNYDLVNIKSEKKVHYDIIQFQNNKFYQSNVSFNEEKNFNVAYNINQQDKRFEELTNKHDKMEDVKIWENTKLDEVSIDGFLLKINNSTKKQLNNINDVYALLNYEQDKPKSFWDKLFGSKKNQKKKVKSASLTSSSYETKDSRFDSVVVVKTGSGMGSGFFISNDEILTNYHVVENAMSISIIDRNKKRSSAVVIKKDLKRDLALLKTNMKRDPVKFYSGQLKQGEMVEALGHPKGRKFSLTKGWISAIRKESSVYNATGAEDVLFIQTDAAINPGNSGGPLFYKDRVIGVNTQGLHKDTSEGMNFAVHFSEVQKFLSQ